MFVGVSTALTAVRSVLKKFARQGLKLYYRFSDTTPDFLLDGSTSFGNDDKIELGTNTFNIGKDGYSYSISAWFKAPDQDDNSGIFSSQSSPSSEFQILLLANGRVHTHVYDGSNQKTVQTSTNDEYNDNQWHHLVSILDSSADTLSLYVDGSLIGSITWDVFTTGSLVAHIGTRYASSNYFEGRIANVGIWDRALSASEVESIYWRGSYSELQNTELTNLVSWYDLQGDVLDKQGSNDGTNNGATLNSDSYSGESPFKPRIQDKATPKMAVQLADGSTSFDGTDDYIDLGSDSSLDNIFAGGGTISVWIYLNGYGEANAGRIASKSNNNASGWNFLVTNAPQIQFISDWSTTDLSADTGAISSIFGLKKWHHVVITYNSTASAGTKPLIYLDGSLLPVQTSSDSVGTVVDDSSSNFHIGNRAGGNDREFDGLIANVSIHSSALTQSQVQELMFTEKYSGLSSALKTNLVSWYDMGSSTNPHNDLEGSNHGTNNGATVNTGYTHSPHGVVDPLNFGETYSGRALSFDGSNDYVTLSKPDFMNGESAFTMSAWALHDDTGSDVIITTNSELFMGYNSGKLTASYRETDNTRNRKVATDVLNSGELYHLCATWDKNGDGEIKLYVNGYYVAQSYNDGGASTASVIKNGTSARVGAWVTGSQEMDGKLSSIKVFNTALTQDQVRELYTKPEIVLPTGVSASNLKLDLPMQEGAGSYIYDGSGNQNHGTIYGATFVTGEEYGYQSSLVRSNTPMIFDGSDDFVNISDNSSLNFGTSDFSISAWIKIDSFGSTREFISKRSGVSNSAGFMLRIHSTGNLAMEIDDGAGNEIYLQGTSPCTANVWHHVVYTFDRSGNCTIYRDGSSITSGSISSVGSISNSVDLEIGSLATFFIGLINEVAMWDVVLDADTVTQLYNSGVPLLPTSDSGNYDNSDSLVGYWRNDGITTWTDRANTGVASFDGVDDRINLGSSVDAGTTNTTSVWFKRNSFGAHQVVLGEDDNSSDYYMFVFSSNNFFVRNGTKYYVYADSATTTALNTADWVHVALVREGISGKLYINGTLTETETMESGTSWTANTTFDTIGAKTSGSNGIDGQIAGTHVFNVALTASEVTELYNIDKRSSISGHSQFSNCVGSWLMGAGTGDTASTIQDQTSNNNDGTVNGASLIGYNDGTATNATTSIVIPEGSTEGRDNQGYYLLDTTTISNGIRLHGSEYIDIQDSEVLSFGDSVDDRPFSLEAWVKMKDASSFMILTKGQYNINAEYNFYTDGSRKLNLTIYDESLSATYRGKKSNTALSSGQWIHVVATYDGTGGTNAHNGINLYINGSVVGTADVNGGSYVAMENLGADLIIGKDGASYSKGLIDEPRIYSKELSASEILKNYNSGISAHQ